MSVPFPVLFSGWLPGAMLACSPTDPADDTMPIPAQTDTASPESRADTAGADTGDEEEETAAARVQLQAALDAALPLAPAGVTGIRLWVLDDAGERVVDMVAGTLDPVSDRMAVGSAAKLVSALVLLRLVEEGALSLADTPAEVLGWSAETAGDMTLDHLGAFASGLPGEADCTLDPRRSLADCVADIATLAPLGPAGTVFDYGSTHLHVAAGMAEVRTGEPWATLFSRTLLEPLGLADHAAEGLRYVTLPQQDAGLLNPLVAGGLRATMEEYAAFLGLLYREGRLPSGETWIEPTRLARMGENHYPDAEMVTWPMGLYGYPFHYGFGTWLECEGPVATCEVISSPGAFGFTPWIDRENQYYAILAMDAGESGAAEFSVHLSQSIRPSIEAIVDP